MALMEYLYTSALNGGFVGTEAQWIASLKGLPGDPGASALTDQKFIVYPAFCGHKLYYFRC
jgi:hypothetical protein